METLRSLDQPLGLAAALPKSIQRSRAVRFVSQFRIDGVPILPPLMTTEKRRQMARLRERAIRVEQNLEDNRRRNMRSSGGFTMVEEMVEGDGTPRSQANSSGSGSGSLSHRSIELDAQRQAEESFMLLTNLMKAHEADSGNVSMPPRHSYMDCSIGVSSPPGSATPSTQTSETNLVERMQKLQKSETLIYDNRANTIIMPISEYECMQRNSNIRDVEEKANLNFMSDKKPMNFSMGNSIKAIPAICVDPPTPLVANRSFCDSIDANTNLDIGNTNKSSGKIKQKAYYDDCSSDESYNSTQLAMHDEGRKEVNPQKVSNIPSDRNPFNHYKEEIGVEDEQISLKPPKRSATSPALNPLNEQTTAISDTVISDLDVSVGTQSENGLVRSNSFTLDSPSQALLEHIRQQNTRSPNTTKRTTALRSAMRDTIESKAKRVQKVEGKSRGSAMRLQSKASSTNIAHGGGSAPSYPTSNTLLFKNKRSPYESKIAGKARVARQLKKSSSGTKASKQVNLRSSMPSIQTSTKSALTDSARNSPIGLLSEIEADHRQRFMELLMQQQQEQQRMQMAFEHQQQKLFEQLTVEMGHLQMHTPSNTGVYMPGGVMPADLSPTSKSECSEYALRSPSQSITSSILSASICATSTQPYEIRTDLSVCSNPMNSYSMPGGRYTPRRRLFAGGELSSPGCGNGGGGAPSSPSASSTSRRSQQQLEETQRRTAAATKINAHVRGYLVRRLFQTEQIQRIVQTIRDTLIFVINLHLETTQNPAEANVPDNIKLKARLLQQLSSASRTLHLVFFQTTIKERMEIISRDRKRIKTKILTMNRKRSPRVHK